MHGQGPSNVNLSLCGSFFDVYGALLTILSPKAFYVPRKCRENKGDFTEVNAR